MSRPKAIAGRKGFHYGTEGRGVLLQTPTGILSAIGRQSGSANLGFRTSGRFDFLDE